MPAVTDASADYCEHCDLPRSQCIHGQPPPPTPAKAVTSPPKPRKRPTTRRSSTPEEPVRRRWTPPEVFEPLILTVLKQAGGTLEADDAFAELEVLAQGRLLPGDTELTPGGELRWRHAARRARMALIDEGLMTKTTPGVWQISASGKNSG